MIPTTIAGHISNQEIQQHYRPMMAIAPDEPALVHYARGWADGAPDVLVFEQLDSNGRSFFILHLLDPQAVDGVSTEIRLNPELNFGDAFNLAHLFAAGQLLMLTHGDRELVGQGATGIGRYP